MCRLIRKLRGAGDPQYIEIRQELVAIVQNKQVAAALDRQPTLLREAAAELGMEVERLPARVIEKVGLDKLDWEELYTLIEPMLGVGSELAIAALSMDRPNLGLSLRVLRRLIGDERVRGAVVTVLRSSVERLIQQVL